MVDDLTTRGVDEPYRMFTSRAEYRLLLREDNADERLASRGRSIGLLCDAAWSAYVARRDAVRAELARLAGTTLVPDGTTQDRLAAIGTPPLRRPATLLELLRRPEVSYAALQQAFGGPALDPEAQDRVEVQVKYQGYVERQAEEAARFRRLEAERIPDALDYAHLAGLSREVREKLARVRPRSIGQASRISGVTPAAVSILLVHARAAARAQS
jgi:tRNA uridine 5-carboxymethylaminomethyl modification enzyme